MCKSHLSTTDTSNRGIYFTLLFMFNDWGPTVANGQNATHHTIGQLNTIGHHTIGQLYRRTPWTYSATRSPGIFPVVAGAMLYCNSVQALTKFTAVTRTCPTRDRPLGARRSGGLARRSVNVLSSQLQPQGIFLCKPALGRR